ncbi:MAG: hypothetical protein D6773_15405 [Alphaproteobacteria bacterium]|nr:MAG: hypothetical protein D6773_15405 [Alphaproteobacteria bacterium]
MAGTFAVSREIWEHPLLASNEPFSRREAWLWLVSEAAWKPTQKEIGGKIVTLQRGQLAHSLRFMAHNWKWSKSKVDRYIYRLKTGTMIDVEPGHSAMLITICNYEKYQPSLKIERDTSGTRAGHERDTNRDKLEKDNNYSVPNGTVVNAGSVADRLPVARAFENYNIAARELGLPLAAKLTADRRRKLQARLREHGLDGWNAALVAIENSRFLRGENGKGWRANLDFLLQPSSLNKLIEGGYADASN